MPDAATASVYRQYAEGAPVCRGDHHTGLTGTVRRCKRTYFLLAVLERGLSEVEVACVVINEDMAYKHASMISPDMVKDFMLPRYRRIVSFLRDHGVPVILFDCDGHIGPLNEYLTRR